MRKGFFVLLVLLGMSGFVSGQSAQPLRIEIPVRAGSSPLNFIAFGEKGVCVFYPTRNDTGKDSISWSFVMLDKNLKEVWRKLIPMHEDVTYLKGLRKNDVIYLLFHDTRRNSDGNIFVFFIYPDKQIITQHRSLIPDKAEVADFEIFNEFALIGYNQRKSVPGLLGFSLINGDKRNFDVVDKKDALLLDVSVDTIHQDIYVVYKSQPSSTRNILVVNLYNSSSTLRKTVQFADQMEKRIINSAQFIPTGDGKGIVTGCYGSAVKSRRNYDYYNDYYNYYYYDSFYRRQSTYDANQDNTPVSDGYFSAAVTDSASGKMQYFSFSEFANASKYLNDPETIRLRRKADKSSRNDAAEENGSIKDYSLNLRLLVHPAEVINGTIVLMAEAYTPEYHTMTQMVYDYYGRSFPSSYSVFDGFRYTNAFVAGIDSSGNMIWNNGMEMRDILTTYLNRRMNLYADMGDLLLFYNANGKLAYKAINGANVVDNTTFLGIAQKRGTDQLESEYLGSVEYWYGNFFLASGYESVRNNFLDENKRNVFYFSKLGFR